MYTSIQHKLLNYDGCPIFSLFTRDTKLLAYCIIIKDAYKSHLNSSTYNKYFRPYAIKQNKNFPVFKIAIYLYLEFKLVILPLLL